MADKKIQLSDGTDNLYPAVRVDQICPVGSIYMSVDGTDPGTLFGGTWEQIQDRFLLCAGSTYAAGGTGSATNAHTHSVTAGGTVGEHTLTVSEIPSHNHAPSNSQAFVTTLNNANTSYNYVTTGSVCPSAYAAYTTNVGGGGSHSHGFTGSAVTSGAASDTNNMPPYLAVYVWKRTA